MEQRCPLQAGMPAGESRVVLGGTLKGEPLLFMCVHRPPPSFPECSGSGAAGSPNAQPPYPSVAVTSLSNP